MTASRGIGRGGPRKGAGRKDETGMYLPKVHRISAAHSGQAAQELARKQLDLAIAALTHVASESPSDAARVAAAKALVEIASPRVTSPVGKREQAQADAETAGHGSHWGTDLDFDPGPPN